MRRLLLAVALLLTPVALAAVHDRTGVPLRPTDLLAADLDRDRDIDVAVVGPCRGKPFICLTGVENERKTLGTVRNVELRSVSLVDPSLAPIANGLVLAGTGKVGPDVVVLHSSGAGAYSFGQRFDLSGGATDVATGDVNGDGRIDIITVGRSGVGVFRGLPGGSFADPVLTSTGVVPVAVTVERLDGDAFADIAYVGGDDLGILELGPGSLTGTPSLFPLGGVAVDLDAVRAGPDATPDLVVATARGVQVFATIPDAGGGIEASDPVFLSGTRPVGVVVADVTRDNLVDIITLNAGSGSLSTNVASAGGGYGTPIRSVPVGANPIGLSLINFNNDGIPDVVVANAAASGVGTVSVLQGNGSGGFTLGPPPTSTAAGTIPVQLGLTYNHPVPNEGFSWICADVTAASGALLNLTLTLPDGRTIGGTLQLKKKATRTAHGSFSFKITELGGYRVRVVARANGRTATATKAITVGSAQGSSSCGP